MRFFLQLSLTRPTKNELFFQFLSCNNMPRKFIKKFHQFDSSSSFYQSAEAQQRPWPPWECELLRMRPLCGSFPEITVVSSKTSKLTTRHFYFFYFSIRKRREFCSKILKIFRSWYRIYSFFRRWDHLPSGRNLNSARVPSAPLG